MEDEREAEKIFKNQRGKGGRERGQAIKREDRERVLQVDCTHYSVHVHRGVKKKTNRKDNVSSQVLVTWKIYCKSPY